MIRSYFHYTELEEYQAGMWRKVTHAERAPLLALAVAFTGDATLYGEWMMKVAQVWEKSCAQNLSWQAQNRQAWIGHAAVSLAIQCPEDVTREAWWLLSEPQRIEANLSADRAILFWERNIAAPQLELFPDA